MKMVVFSTYAIQFDLKMTTLIRYDCNLKNVLLGFAIIFIMKIYDRKELKTETKIGHTFS